MTGAVIERLALEARTTAAGARSLGHVLAIVPTTESGRRLRRGLAKRFGSLIPPETMTPPRLFAAADSIAPRSAEIVAFAEALGKEAAMDVAVQLSDIRAILGANALTFADVAAVVAEKVPPCAAELESKRWRELAATEERYLAALRRRGLEDRVVAMQKTLAGTEIEDGLKSRGIEKIFVCAVTAPLPAFEKALAGIRSIEIVRLPLAEDRVLSEPSRLTLRDMVPCGTAASEADRIAGIFASVKPDEELPALCVADPSMFTELTAAFGAKGLKLHDPSATRLATSSLGHLVAQIAALLRTSSYQVFSSFVRGGDVRRWLEKSIPISPEEMTQALTDLDNRQAELLPEKIADIMGATRGKLRAIFEFVTVRLRKRGIREILEEIFRDFILDERKSECREFAAAAEVTERLLTECFDPAVPERMRNELFAKMVDEAVYSLEPDDADAIVADGWLELPFLDAPELVIAGFCEGCVPESTLGHAFLPDSLRKALGLVDNESRGARDQAILREACARRESGAVTVFFHSVDARGDVLKPSRLLFDTADDTELCDRVKALYSVRAGTGDSKPRDLPESWKLSLPVPPEEREIVKMSPTRLDGYLRCPFTFYLSDKEIIGDKRLDDRAEELASWEYGNLAHGALEAWGGSELRDSCDAEAIRRFLEDEVDKILALRFGTAIPAIVAMQGESVKRRLDDFAKIQAAHRAQGWQIRAVERKLEVEYGHTRLYGKCDRIDFNAGTGEWCVIDYKTWDSVAKVNAGSLQLPIYCAMLDASREEGLAEAKLDKISSCYCVLGKTSADVTFTERVNGGCVAEAEKTVRELIGRIEKGIFWPPGKGGEWKWGYADFLGDDPAGTVSSEWIADQERRIAAAGGGA